MIRKKIFYTLFHFTLHFLILHFVDILFKQVIQFIMFQLRVLRKFSSSPNYYILVLYLCHLLIKFHVTFL